MAERELIDYIRRLAAHGGPPWASVGIGDDAAVLDLPGGGPIAVTIDSVIEGVHFEPETPPGLVGRKAIARALSDIAAMAARPLCTVAAAAFLADSDQAACEELCRALWETSRELSAPLVGGDVAAGPGPLSITVTAVGTAGPRGFVTRAGAQAGDAVCVTGRLGGSLRGRHLTFRPRLHEALELAECFDLHALIDISDGLSTDALHVAEASGVGLALRAEDIPVSDDALALAEEAGREPFRHALNDGEDYELLFCVPAVQAQQLAAGGLAGVQVSVVGEVTGGSQSSLVLPDGRREPLTAAGWEHLT
ncbi:MAG: thiamine-phosphate kinase, partial [Planctomycetota bacterium]|jgi:thiamine-monophosphate kinase